MAMPPEHQMLWSAALPYLGVRRNDIHSAYVYAYARRLGVLEDVDRKEALVLAGMLHDVGWSAVPEEKILFSFGPNSRYPELRRFHETEGMVIAAKLLEEWGAVPGLIDDVVELIDGHDTLAHPSSAEQALLREADKMWCFTPIGFEIVREWFNHTAEEHMAFLEGWLSTRFYTVQGTAMAHGLFASLEVGFNPDLTVPDSEGRAGEHVQSRPVESG